MPPAGRSLIVPIGMLAAIGCAQLGIGRAPRAEGVAMPVSEGYVVAADGARLFYRTIGDGPDTIVAVHGGPGLHMGTLVSFEPLAAGGTVIFYDQRGGGRSSLPQHAEQVTAALHVSDLDAVLRHFSIGRATLLGHSWGAALAGLYAIEHPQRVARLILVGPMPVRAEPHMREYFAKLPALLGADSSRFRKLHAAWDTTSSPHAVCRELVPITMRAGGAVDTAAITRVTGGVCSTGVPTQAMRIGWTRTLQWTLTSFGMWDLRLRLRSVPAQALVVWGERDPISEAAAREWASALPNAQVVVVPGTGHYPHAEDPAAFARIVREFLGRD
ncbi:MAG TPA: alpha/beta hydrolase [Gemmatimonadaceae bacterium]|nr:alpha/beta hydrolase [Gemmatimonadaceae bacterium]